MEKKPDRKKHIPAGGTLSALLVLVACVLAGRFILRLVGMLGGVGGLAAVQLLVIGAIAAGVLIALVQRWRETGSGEEEEARKY